MLLYKAKCIVEEYQYGKKFSLDEPSMFDKFTDKLGKKILSSPRVKKSIVSGITTAIVTNDNEKAFKSAVKSFKENHMSSSKKYIMNNIVHESLRDMATAPNKPLNLGLSPHQGTLKAKAEKLQKKNAAIAAHDAEMKRMIEMKRSVNAKNAQQNAQKQDERTKSIKDRAIKQARFDTAKFGPIKGK